MSSSPTTTPADGIDAVALLADPLRRRIVELLAAEQRCTCHLVDETGASQPTVSYHLKVLRESGWVRAEPVGRYTYYELDPTAVAQLADALHALADRAGSAGRRRLPCD